MRRRYALLVAFSVLVALAFQGTRGLYEPSEGRYAEVAREMRESGNYLEPTLGYRPHWTKPPLTYWAVAGGLATLGDNAWGVRAYEVVAFSVTTLAVAATGATLWGPATGFVAGLIYMTAPLPVVGANVATADMLLAMWMALALFAYARAWRGRAPAVAVRMMWLMFGLGFFTKGPPALLPLLALIAFHFLARRPFRFFDAPGLSLFVVSAFWWFGLVALRQHDLLSYFIGKEVVARSASSEFHRNAHWWGPFVVYLPGLTLGCGFWLIDGIRAVNTRALRRGSASALLSLWIGIPLVVFALSRSRLPLYILPLFGAIALAIAREITISRGEGATRHAMRLAAVGLVLIIGLKAFASFLPRDEDATRLYREAARMAGPDAQYALFAEPARFGFQFYAGNEMKRLSFTGEEAWSDGRVADALAGRDTNRNLAIVTSPRAAPNLAASLHAAHVSFEQRRAAGREVFVVAASSVSPQTGPLSARK